MSILVENLTKIYDEQRAVNNISFKVEKGEVLGFLGPNGAGKSTTMKMLTCFLPQTAGNAFVCGHNISKDTLNVRKCIGYLPEHNPLYLDMYVKEYLQFIGRLYKLGDKSSARIEEMIEMTGLTPERNKKIGQLSKGFRQRVGLAQAMLHNPEVLILDEPTSGLDPNQILEIRSLIKAIGKEKTVILSTHIMQEVQAICSRVIIINKGKLVADGSPEQLKKRISGGNVVVTVEFKDAVDENALKGINGVTDLTTIGKNKYQVYHNEDKDLREAIFNFAVKQKAVITELHKESKSLEEAFHELTIEQSETEAKQAQTESAD